MSMESSGRTHLIVSRNFVAWSLGDSVLKLAVTETFLTINVGVEANSDVLSRVADARHVLSIAETKNQWARDDPAFVVLLSLFLTMCAIAYGLVYKVGFVGMMRLILYMVLVDFLLVGVVVATFNWWVIATIGQRALVDAIFCLKGSSRTGC